MKTKKQFIEDKRLRLFGGTELPEWAENFGGTQVIVGKLNETKVRF